MLSQEARNLALRYGGQQFLIYIITVFMPNSRNNQRRLLLRTDFPIGDDRNIVNAAWSQYRRTI